MRVDGIARNHHLAFVHSHAEIHRVRPAPVLDHPELPQRTHRIAGRRLRGSSCPARCAASVSLIRCTLAEVTAHRRAAAAFRGQISDPTIQVRQLMQQCCLAIDQVACWSAPLISAAP